MAVLTYDSTIDYVRLLTLAGGDPAVTELLADGVTVSNTSVTQLALDNAVISYTAGTVPLAELESNADAALDSITLGQAILGDPTALGVVSNQLGTTRPATVVQNIYAPPAVGAGGAGGAPTTVAEAQTQRKAELEIEFSNLMTAGKVIKSFKINTTLHSLQKWRASIDLVVYSGYSDDLAQDADGLWQTVTKRDMSKIMTDGYKHYRNNLDLLQAGKADVDAAVSISAASAVTVSWV